MYIFSNFESMSWMVGALLVVVSFSLIALLGIFLTRYSISKQHLKAHHDVAGFVFTNIGVLYAVLLGFTVVNVQQRFDATKNMVELEAVNLANLYQDTYVFPEKHRDAIRLAVKTYLKSVIEEEWGPSKERLQANVTQEALKQVWKAFYEMSSLTDIQRVWYQESIRKLNDLTSARLNRVIASKESLGDEMWALLLIGGVFVVGFICFFSFENMSLHILMAFILATSIGLLLYLIYSLDTTFEGSLAVQPDALINVYQNFD